MFTSKDVQYRTIFVINCIKDRNLRVSNGELLLEETEEKKTLRLKRELSQDYYKVFVEALMPQKMRIFIYVQAYYRAFMRNAPTNSYPHFIISS